jgi:formylglycine-generating enzyme required for sulfatase activity
MLVTVRARADDAMATVGPAVYEPFFPPSPAERSIPVAAFALDRVPVTSAQFRDFVRAHPEWRRDRVARLFAEPGYLARWPSPTDVRAGDEDRAVTEVSWFAAKAYCAARGARLPTEAEWEVAAAASPTQKDGRKDPVWRAQILDWYGRPNGATTPKVGGTAANVWGVRDLHGVVWEWVLDFNSMLITTDPRSAADKSITRFCGAGGISATDKDDYPTFMRLGFRSSLKADYTTQNLGFRCAADLPKAKPR